MTHVHSVAIRNIEQALLQEPSRTMRHHAITFHLTKTQSTVPRATFSRLPSQNLSRSPRSGMNLVTDHMLQTLIISGAQEDHDLQLLSSEAIVHYFITVFLVAESVQLLCDKIDSLALERRSITFITIKRSDF